jgi:serine/threonine-protein kinase
MGVVYKAEQLHLHRVVALKMIRAWGVPTAEQLARFRGEAAAIARLDHDNIVRVYDFGEHHGLPYFSMEFVEGGSLHERRKAEPMTPGESARLLEALARAASTPTVRESSTGI